MPKSPGIYKITNLVTGQIYIGSSSNVYNRIHTHKKCLRKNTHENKRLQNSWNKYNEDSFVFELVEECEIDKIIEREQYYIDSLNPFYNICRVAGSCIGVKHTEETRKRMSDSKKGKPSPRKGTKHTEESLKRMSEVKKGIPSARKGTKCSEESKKKMRESAKKRDRNYSQETRQKLSEAAHKRWSKKCHV